MRMQKTISEGELRNESCAVLREVRGGRTFVVTRNGEPIAELQPIRRRTFVSRGVIAEAASNAPPIDAEQFRNDVDATIDQSVDG